MGEGDHGNDVHWRPRGADPLRRWRTVSPTINLCLPGESNNLATMRTVLSDAGRGRDEDADLVQGDKIIYMQVAPNAKSGDPLWRQSAILVMMMCTKLACSAGLLNDTYGLPTSPKRKTTSADVSSATAMVFPHIFVRLEARSSGVVMSWSRDICAPSSSRVMWAVLVQHSSLTTVKTSHCGLC